ncbi:hypothetical protein CG710_001565 [Lachnotalea glycerini]|uniref:Uncharacterized protein n=1 Tax=Lachnotalea glycerini TaxID=1763509 RepID=A0A371JKI6_9FIRM|nr:hypothetical protein CG710_001565 [Lachnotalea glycerini]
MDEDCSYCNGQLAISFNAKHMNLISEWNDLLNSLFIDQEEIFEDNVSEVCGHVRYAKIII